MQLRTKEVTCITNGGINIKQVKSVHLVEQLLSQTPAEKFDETLFTIECSNSLFALFMQIKKTISIGVRICCQIRDFRSLCSSRSHKRSKFNSKCGPTFSSSCAWRSAGVQVFSVMFYRNVFLNDKNIKSIRP